MTARGRATTHGEEIAQMLTTPRLLRMLTVTGLTGAVVGAIPLSACAQDAAGSTPPTVVVRLDNGLSVESREGDTKFQVGGLVQVDGRFDVADPTSTVINTFVLRRTRPIFQGRVSKIFEF